MPTFTHGKDAIILLDNTNLSTTLTDASLSLTADVTETSTFSSSSKTYVAGLKDGTATLSGYFESSSPDADAEFLAQLGGSGAAFSIAPIGYTRGNAVSFGTTIETSYDRSADVGSVVAVAVAFQFSGDAYDGKSDNASFSDYITFTQATGTTSELKTSASNPARYARAVLTFGGSGSITAAVGFAQG
jgi:hypothetical protein